MRLVSDLGGLPAGPIDRSEHVLTAREKRIDAMKSLTQAKDPLFTSDVSRRAQEELPAEQYEGLPYYDRWLVGFRRNLVERGYLTEAEIEARVAELRARR